MNYSRDARRRDHVQMVVNHHHQLLDFQHLTKQQIDNMEDFLYMISDVLEIQRIC